MTGEWRKLHNEELNELYSLRNIVRVVKSRRIKCSGHVARVGEDRVLLLLGKPEGMGQLGRPRRRWEEILRWIFRRWRESWGLDGVGSV